MYKNLNKLNDMIKQLGEKKSHNNIHEKVLLVDGLNLFIRGYTSNPSLNVNGEHIGGVVGSLLSLTYAIKTFSPTRCIVVFDGKESYKEKRKIYEYYKTNRKEKPKPKYNRKIESDNEQSEELNKQWQINRFIQYLEVLPITIIQIDGVEADDVIAYINKRLIEIYESNTIIMSSDKDFLQLVNNNTSLWSPTKKKFYDVNTVIEEYGIHPSKFVYYRIIDGDPSDNIPGIEGFGLKTIQDIFGSILSNSIDECVVDVDILLEEGKKNYNLKPKSKTLYNFINNYNILKRNYNIMQLKDPLVDDKKQLDIIEIIERRPQLQTLSTSLLNIMFIKDYMHNIIKNTIEFIRSFDRLNNFCLYWNENNKK